MQDKQYRMKNKKKQKLERKKGKNIKKINAEIKIGN